MHTGGPRGPAEFDFMTFDHLGLSDDVQRAVADAGYEKPTPIQEKAIPYILQGKDILGVAQTGTGKTASFTLPMIDILSAGRAKARMPRTLILEPTRELAAQVADNFEIYGKYHSLTMALLIGGVSFDEQYRKLDRGVDVLVATPGRLLDHFERGRLMLTGVSILVVDEADRMLDMGFIPDVERIRKLIPGHPQTLFFSATMPAEIQRMAKAFLNEPVRVEVARPATTVDNVVQGLAIVGEREKRKTLETLLSQSEVRNALIFCNRKKDVDELYKKLRAKGLKSAALHGDLAQSHRMEVLASFMAGEIDILVASDVAARGLDIPNVSHVFNFDVPTHPEDYVHRIGRTARAGKSGFAYTIATPAEAKYVSAIESLTGEKIPRLDVPGVSSASPQDEAKPEAEEPRRRRRGRRGGSRRRPRSDTRNEGQKQASASNSPKAAPARQKKEPGGGQQGSREAPKGLGEHTPAFMLRGSDKPEGKS